MTTWRPDREIKHPNPPLSGKPRSPLAQSIIQAFRQAWRGYTSGEATEMANLADDLFDQRNELRDILDIVSQEDSGHDRIFHNGYPCRERTVDICRDSQMMWAVSEDAVAHIEKFETEKFVEAIDPLLVSHMLGVWSGLQQRGISGYEMMEYFIASVEAQIRGEFIRRLLDMTQGGTK